MIDGITVRVLGDYGPFSRVGKSIGYQVTIGESSFLVDCGAPLFQQIGGHGLKNVKGLIITHCHDDHKRWFSDMALFNKYAPDIDRLLTLFTTEEINRGLESGSASALETSLSDDSLKVIDIGYNEYVDFHLLGPRAKYRIVSQKVAAGLTRLVVVDRNNDPVGPEMAKIIISSRTAKPRLLFYDPVYNEWVEPESFYPFSSSIFYEDDKNIYRDPQGFSIEAINAPVWHGISCVGVKFSTADESLVFSSDTNHDLELWERLYLEKHLQRYLTLSAQEFAEATVIYGDINDFIERTWSEERFRDAVSTFQNSVVIHDIGIRKTVVHTDYRRLNHTVLEKDFTILTHSPDKMTSEWILGDGDKYFWIKRNAIFEQVGEEHFYFDADLYHKENGRYFVGYRHQEGEIAVYDHNGLLSLSIDSHRKQGGVLAFRVNLYEDCGGHYLPRLVADTTSYHKRSDGRIEMVEVTPEGSRGTVVTGFYVRRAALQSE